MPRQKTTKEERQRAKRLADALRRRGKQRTIQELSDSSGLGYETVRALLTGRSVGPSFFLVADLARALDVKLDQLAKETS